MEFLVEREECFTGNICDDDLWMLRVLKFKILVFKGLSNVQ